MEDLYNSLDEVINCIKDSPEYIKCNELKKKMSNNKEITELVNKIKKLQKESEIIKKFKLLDNTKTVV